MKNKFLIENEIMDKIEHEHEEIKELTRLKKVCKTRGDRDSSEKHQIKIDSIKKNGSELTPRLCTLEELDQISAEISRIDPVPRLDQPAKLDAKATFLKIREKDDNLFQYLKYVSRLTSRGKLYAASGSLAAPYCALVPLFMMPYKKFRDIPYESWHTEDQVVTALGNKLGLEYQKYHHLQFTDEQVAEMRERALMSPSKGKLAPSAWPNHSVTYYDLKLPSTSLFRHMLCQTWMANVQHRNEYMILDLNDWDKMPEAMDELIEENSPTIPMAKKIEEYTEDLPW